LALDPLPSVDKMFNTVHQEEHHKNMMLGRNNRAETVEAFAVTGKTMQTRANRATCKHCGKFNHEEVNCYELIEHPPTWLWRLKQSRWKSCIQPRMRCRMGASPWGVHVSKTTCYCNLGWTPLN